MHCHAALIACGALLATCGALAEGGVRPPVRWEPGDLAGNPGLELGLDMELCPRGWHSDPVFPNATYDLADLGPPQGHALRIAHPTQASGRHADGGWAARGFPVVEGVAYRFSAALCPLGASRRNYLTLSWYDAQYQWLGNTRNGCAVEGSVDWVRVAVADTPPAGAASVTPYFRSDGSEGEAVGDDFRLEALAGPTCEIAVANGDFAVPEPSVWGLDGVAWESAGAHSGEGCLSLPRGANAATTSSLVGTQTMGGGSVAAVLWVDTHEAASGSVEMLWLWSQADGRTLEGPPTPIALGSDGYAECSLPFSPPQGAIDGRLVVRASGLDAPVRVDDVSLRLDTGREASPDAVALATARAYMGDLPMPDIIDERFHAVFPDPAQVEALAGRLQTYLAASPNDTEIILFLSQCLLRTGQAKQALDLATPLTKSVAADDPHYDFASYIAHFASAQARQEERATRRAELDARRAGAPLAEDLKKLAQDYRDADEPGAAADIYLELCEKGRDEDERRWAAYRAGVCLSQGGRHEEAVERLRDFLADSGWTRWTPECRLSLARSLAGLERYAEAIGLLTPTLADPTWPLPDEARDLVKACERRLRTSHLAPDAPRLVYLGADTETQGDWMGAYGESAFILCAMSCPRDIVGGGAFLPVHLTDEDPPRRVAIEPVPGCAGEQLAYTSSTTQPGRPPRVFLHVPQTDDRRALLNPIWGRRSFALWDDRGELTPFDEHGPDLVTRIAIPDGAFVLSLYFLDWDHDPTHPFPPRHHVTVTDQSSGQTVDFNVSDFGEGVYHQIAVRGPTDVVFHIEKGQSLCAALSGVFLDPIQPPGIGVTPAASDELLARALASLGEDPLTATSLRADVATAPATTPDDALAKWMVAASFPGNRERLRRAAADWVSRSTREQALIALRAAVASNSLRATESLCEAFLAQWPEPEVMVEVAKALRMRHLPYAEELLRRCVDEEIAQGKAEAVLALASEWRELGVRDNEEHRNLCRTTLGQAETLYRRFEAAAGADALGEEGLYGLAVCAMGRCWYGWGYEDAGAEWRRFLDTYPESERKYEALEALTRCANVCSQTDPREVPSPWLEDVARRLSALPEAAESEYVVLCAMKSLAAAYRYRGEGQQERRWLDRAARSPARAGAGGRMNGNQSGSKVNR